MLKSQFKKLKELKKNKTEWVLIKKSNQDRKWIKAPTQVMSSNIILSKWIVQGNKTYRLQWAKDI